MYSEMVHAFQSDVELQDTRSALKARQEAFWLKRNRPHTLHDGKTWVPGPHVLANHSFNERRQNEHVQGLD